MSKIVGFITLIVFAQSQLSIEIFYSSYTDLSLMANISTHLKGKFNSQIDLKIAEIKQDRDYLNRNCNSTIILDLTSSISYANLLKELSREKHFILVSFSPDENFDNWEFFIHNPLTDHVSAIFSLINYLNWKKFVTISGLNFNMMYTSLSRQISDKEIHNFYLSDEVSQDSADLFIGKAVKPTGIKNFVIFNEGDGLKTLIKSIKSKNLLKEGTGILLGSQSIWAIKENGLLAAIESGLENSTSYYNYEALAVEKFVKLVISFNDFSDPISLRNLLEKNTINHHPQPLFSLLNIQNSTKVYVGSIFDRYLNISRPIIYPGNSTISPNSPSTAITISMADGVINPGAANSTTAYIVKDGARYAFANLQKTHFLDNFDISITHTSCGAEVFNASFAIPCFQRLRSKLGVAILTTTSPLLCVGNIMTFRALNITIPHISDVGSAGVLTPNAVYPEFMRVVRDSRYTSSAFLAFAAVFNWKNIIVLYENTTWSKLAYDYYVNQTGKTHINIVNTQTMIGSSYNHDAYSANKKFIKYLLDLRIRVFVMFMATPAQFYFIEDLHKAGLKKGDGIFIFPARMSESLAIETDPIQKSILNSMLYGSIVVDQADWVGKLGQEIKKGIIANYPGSLTNRCFSYDSALLLMNGIKSTLDEGNNLENSTILNKNLRKQRFTGCSGIVSIENGSNERSVITFGIYNMKWNETTNSLYDHWVAKYDVTSEQLITFFEDIVWNNNKTEIPGDKVIYYDNCPFDKSFVRYSEKGSGVLYGIGSGMIIYSLIFSFFTWKRWGNQEIKELKEKSPKKFDYYIMEAMIFTDFLQFLSMGPEIKEFDSYSYTVANYASLNFGWLTQGRRLWIYVVSSIISIFIWVYIAIIPTFSFTNKKYGKIIFINNEIISKTGMPIIGNACFLPMISVLLSVFQCNEGISDDLDDSFVHNDCTVFCWRNTHLSWAYISIIALIVYLPLAVFYRPYWDSTDEDIKMKARPSFLMIKSIFQIFVIFLNKTLKPVSEPLYGLIYFLAFCGFSVWCSIKKPYNYHRLNLWVLFSYFAIIWSTLISSLFWLHLYDESVLMWISLLYVGWIPLLAAAIFIQYKYCPSLLYSEKAPDIGIFFRFSLGSKISADEINKSIRLRMESRCSFRGEEDIMRVPDNSYKSDISDAPNSNPACLSHDEFILII